MKSSHLRQKQTSYTSRQRFLSPYLQFRSLTGTHPALIFRCQGRIGFMVPVATPLGTEVRITGQRFIFPLKAKAVEKYTHKLVCKMGYWYSKKDYAYYVCNWFILWKLVLAALLCYRSTALGSSLCNCC